MPLAQPGWNGIQLRIQREIISPSKQVGPLLRQLIRMLVILSLLLGQQQAPGNRKSLSSQSLLEARVRQTVLQQHIFRLLTGIWNHWALRQAR